MSNKFTEKAERALNNAVKIAESLGHTYIGSEHILLSLVKEQSSSASGILAKHKIDAERLTTSIKEFSGYGTKSSLNPKDMTPRCRKIVENSYRISIRYGAVRIGTEHILLAILEERDSSAVKLLKSFGTDTNILYDEIQTTLRVAEKHFEFTPKNTTLSLLNQYGKNLTEQAQSGKCDPVIGREKETERLIRILCRKNKNNPCLIGEAGVGKTAIVEGLAQRISEGKVPPLLKDKKIYSVDLTSMVAGAKYRGDFEERIKNIINEAAKNKNIILFIDEIHTIVGAGSAEGAIDAANILKPQLSRAEIQLIGATTYNEYHKYIEKDAALERRFQALNVNEPSEEESFDMLLGLKEKYEKHHGVKIQNEAIKCAINLSVKYIQNRYLPDKAIDILDEACAKVSMNSANHLFLKSRYNSEQNYNNNVNYDELKLIYENSGTAKNEKTTLPLVSEKEIKEIVNEMTGIPINGLGKSVDLRELRDYLNDNIIGQLEAVTTVSEAVIRSEIGINSPDRPKGVFLFIGESGVGKTELAKALAKKLFWNDNSIIRYDMSEFSEKNSVTKLIGSPPGYVGHENGGDLTEKIRRKPYSLILLDEIEKADTDVLDLFLQIFDEGLIKDSAGRSASFKNSYIVMTSNVGADKILDKSVGFLNTQDNRNTVFQESLKKTFRSEFLNRIDEIVCFSPLSIETLENIASKKLFELKERLNKLSINLSYSPLLSYRLAELSYGEKKGARGLLKVLRREVENKISQYLIECSSKNIFVGVTDGDIYVQHTENEICI